MFYATGYEEGRNKGKTHILLPNSLASSVKL